MDKFDFNPQAFDQFDQAQGMLENFGIKFTKEDVSKAFLMALGDAFFNLREMQFFLARFAPFASAETNMNLVQTIKDFYAKFEEILEAEKIFVENNPDVK